MDELETPEPDRTQQPDSTPESGAEKAVEPAAMSSPPSEFADIGGEVTSDPAAWQAASAETAAMAAIAPRSEFADIGGEVSSDPAAWQAASAETAAQGSPDEGNDIALAPSGMAKGAALDPESAAGKDLPEEGNDIGLGAPAAAEADESTGVGEPALLGMEPREEAILQDLLPEPAAPPEVAAEDQQLRAVLEAIVYVAEEPLTLAQIAAALQQSPDRVRNLLEQLVTEFDRPEHGVTIREVAGGYKMATKPEHHDAVRAFVKSLKPPLKLSLPALETLAVIAYKQPVTGPEIMEIRGVQGAGVLKTLLDRKLIAVAGRKNVIGKPILYKTTKEFLIQFGLKDLSELPSLKEFEDIRRMALSDSDVPPVSAAPADTAAASAEPAAGGVEAAVGEAETATESGQETAAEGSSAAEPPAEGPAT